MFRISLLAGAAALAIAAPAFADKGGGHGNHGPNAAQSEPHGGHGGGHGNSGGGRPAKVERSTRHDVHVERHNRGQERRAAQAEFARGDRSVRLRGRDRDVHARGRGFDDRFSERRSFDDSPRFAGLGRGCPPGLARKHNGCLPPGQAKKIYRIGDRPESGWFRNAAFPAGYRGFYFDSPDQYYRYGDSGDIYRVDSRSNLISGLIPLLGGGFGIGQPLPAGYDVYNVPYQYRGLYQDSDETLYRYGDNAIYGVDPQTNSIESIVALLTGDLSVGNPLPAGYDAYNLPLDYRDQYADGEDYQYRYADGNIYQVDTKTQIIQAIVEMLV